MVHQIRLCCQTMSIAIRKSSKTTSRWAPRCPRIAWKDASRCEDQSCFILIEIGHDGASFVVISLFDKTLTKNKTWSSDQNINFLFVNQTLHDQHPIPFKHYFFWYRMLSESKETLETTAAGRATATKTKNLTWPNPVQSSHPGTCISRSDPSLWSGSG